MKKVRRSSLNQGKYAAEIANRSPGNNVVWGEASHRSVAGLPECCASEAPIHPRVHRGPAVAPF